MIVKPGDYVRQRQDPSAGSSKVYESYPGPGVRHTWLHVNCLFLVIAVVKRAACILTETHGIRWISCSSLDTLDLDETMRKMK